MNKSLRCNEWMRGPPVPNLVKVTYCCYGCTIQPPTPPVADRQHLTRICKQTASQLFCSSCQKKRIENLLLTRGWNLLQNETQEMDPRQRRSTHWNPVVGEMRNQILSGLHHVYLYRYQIAWEEKKFNKSLALGNLGHKYGNNLQSQEGQRRLRRPATPRILDWDPESWDSRLGSWILGSWPMHCFVQRLQKHCIGLLMHSWVIVMAC